MENFASTEAVHVNSIFGFVANGYQKTISLGPGVIQEWRQKENFETHPPTFDVIYGETIGLIH